jgi:SPP1 family predicted phage head-tail adaptor
MLRHKETIGRMDFRITFQEKVIGTNVSNEDEEQGWDDIATNPTVWASKDDRSGAENYQADKLTDYGKTIFICRYRTDITAEMRVLCNGEPFNIIAPPREIGRRRFLLIETESGGAFVEDEGAGFTSGFTSGFNVS